VSPDDLVAIDSNPGDNPLGKRQVLVEAGPWVVATDGRVVVDLAMVLDELRVQAFAGCSVLRSVCTDLHDWILPPAPSQVAG
jgi:hypothetical protein